VFLKADNALTIMYQLPCRTMLSDTRFLLTNVCKTLRSMWSCLFLLTF